jgi:nucleoside-diphosphate-sugar epimerase
MRVFVTGASGWIGSATVEDLLAAGHQVIGLARSEASAAAIKAQGADVLHGDLDDLACLRRGAGEAEAVVHLANKHDWADPAGSDRAERLAVETMLAALEGSNRPFVVANGLSGLVQGRPATEADPSPALGPDGDRGGSENLALDYASRGVRTMSSRFAPSVHGSGDWGFVAFLADAARKQGVSGYIGDGSTAWSAVHRVLTAGRRESVTLLFDGTNRCEISSSQNGAAIRMNVAGSASDPAAPASRGILYSKTGALMWRGSSETITIVAPA